jgi:hypothetical protein
LRESFVQRDLILMPMRWRVDLRAMKQYDKGMNHKTKRSRKIGTPPSERVANAATGAVVGAVVAGPVGAVAGAAIGAMVEKGMPRRKGTGDPRNADPIRSKNRGTSGSDA